MAEMGLRSRRETAEDRLHTYIDPSDCYAFHTYDRLYGEDGPLLATDVLLANLLSLRLGWRQVIPLFADNGPWATLRTALDTALTDLAQAGPFEDYDSVGDLERAVASLAGASGPPRTRR